MGPKSFVVEDWATFHTETIHAFDHDLKEFEVRYPRPGKPPFRLKFRQKPNPVGFHVRLPGDKR